MLDITLCTSDLTDRIANWRVSNEPSLSDHEQIRFDVVAGTPERPQWKRNPRDTDWVNYSADLAESLRDFPKAIDDVPTLEAAANMLKDEILNAYHNNCQLTKLRPRGQGRWRNKGLAALRERTRALLRKARKRKDRLCWQEYNRERDRYKEGIRQGQQTKWASFCEEDEGGADAARLNQNAVKQSRGCPWLPKTPERQILYIRSRDSEMPDKGTLLQFY